MPNHTDTGRLIDDDEARAGELCPSCRHFNSPPADDTCEHIAAWTWDGQVEPLGAGQPFAREWSTFAELASGAEEDSTDGIVLRAHARRNALRAELIALAGQGVPLGQALERVAQAVTGEGWSSGGVLGGSGHGWYVRSPKRLDELTSHCLALHEACTQLVVEVVEGGTGGLQVAVPTDELTWELATGGRWEEDMYHSGYINYYVASLGGGRWLMRSVQRNGELDHVTQEDVDEGHLNDDQIQAMWGMTLEEAQAAEFEQIAAACSGASPDADALEIAEVLYSAVVREGGMAISEPYGGGLLDA